MCGRWGTQTIDIAHRLIWSNGKALQERVCGRWGTQTIDIAHQNSEVTVSPPGGEGGMAKEGGFRGGGGRNSVKIFSNSVGMIEGSENY